MYLIPFYEAMSLLLTFDDLIKFTFTFIFSHFADAFIQSDLQLGNT